MDSRYQRRAARASSLPLTIAAAALFLAELTGCAAARKPTLQPLDREIDLERFMGRWYVLAHIPIDNFLASEADAFNAVEEYELAEDGTIATTFTFRAGGFDGPEKKFEPTGFVHDERSKTEWRMQFLWPFKSAYLIVHLDDDYEKTIIGVPDRSHAWLMARSPEIPEAEYRELVGLLERMGYDLDGLRKVPQRW